MNPMHMTPIHTATTHRSALTTRRVETVALTACLLLGASAHAQPHSHAEAPPPAAIQSPGPSNGSAGSLPWVDAEVRKVDPSTGRLTLKHAAIPNLDMPGMTMVFVVPQPALLAGLQAGDRIQVTVEKVGGQYTVQNLRR